MIQEICAVRALGWRGESITRSNRYQIQSKFIEWNEKAKLWKLQVKKCNKTEIGRFNNRIEPKHSLHSRQHCGFCFYRLGHFGHGICSRKCCCFMLCWPACSVVTLTIYSPVYSLLPQFHMFLYACCMF